MFSQSHQVILFRSPTLISRFLLDRCPVSLCGYCRCSYYSLLSPVAGCYTFAVTYHYSRLGHSFFAQKFFGIPILLFCALVRAFSCINDTRHSVLLYHSKLNLCEDSQTIIHSPIRLISYHLCVAIVALVCSQHGPRSLPPLAHWQITQC